MMATYVTPVVPPVVAAPRVYLGVAALCPAIPGPPVVGQLWPRNT